MSIAPWWCGVIIATKSRSMSPLGLAAMSFIILIIAASFSLRNAASSLEAGGWEWASWARTNGRAPNANRTRAPMYIMAMVGPRNRIIIVSVDQGLSCGRRAAGFIHSGVDHAFVIPSG